MAGTATEDLVVQRRDKGRGDVEWRLVRADGDGVPVILRRAEDGHQLARADHQRDAVEQRDHLAAGAVGDGAAQRPRDQLDVVLARLGRLQGGAGEHERVGADVKAVAGRESYRARDARAVDERAVGAVEVGELGVAGAQGDARRQEEGRGWLRPRRGPTRRACFRRACNRFRRTAKFSNSSASDSAVRPVSSIAGTVGGASPIAASVGGKVSAGSGAASSADPIWPGSVSRSGRMTPGDSYASDATLAASAATATSAGVASANHVVLHRAQLTVRPAEPRELGSIV